MAYLKSKLPEFDVPVRLDPFSLESLIAWLEKQDGDAEYCWFGDGQCLFKQYGLAMGLGDAIIRSLPEGFASSAYNAVTAGSEARYEYPTCEPFNIALQLPHTFSAALSRARNALASLNTNEGA